jgi:hypothetical protein
VIQIGATLAH